MSLLRAPSDESLSTAVDEDLVTRLRQIELEKARLVQDREALLREAEDEAQQNAQLKDTIKQLQRQLVMQQRETAKHATSQESEIELQARVEAHEAELRRAQRLLEVKDKELERVRLDLQSAEEEKETIREQQLERALQQMTAVLREEGGGDDLAASSSSGRSSAAATPTPQEQLPVPPVRAKHSVSPEILQRDAEIRRLRDQLDELAAQVAQPARPDSPPPAAHDGGALPSLADELGGFSMMPPPAAVSEEEANAERLRLEALQREAAEKAWQAEQEMYDAQAQVFNEQETRFASEAQLKRLLQEQQNELLTRKFLEEEAAAERERLRKERIEQELKDWELAQQLQEQPPAAAPAAAPAASAAPEPLSPELGQLVREFPSLEAEVIKSLLEANGGDVAATQRELQASMGPVGAGAKVPPPRPSQPPVATMLVGESVAVFAAAAAAIPAAPQSSLSFRKRRAQLLEAKKKASDSPPASPVFPDVSKPESPSPMRRSAPSASEYKFVPRGNAPPSFDDADFCRLSQFGSRAASVRGDPDTYSLASEFDAAPAAAASSAASAQMCLFCNVALVPHTDDTLLCKQCDTVYSLRMPEPESPDLSSGRNPFFRRKKRSQQSLPSQEQIFENVVPQTPDDRRALDKSGKERRFVLKVMRDSLVVLGVETFLNIEWPYENVKGSDAAPNIVKIDVFHNGREMSIKFTSEEAFQIYTAIRKAINAYVERNDSEIAAPMQRQELLQIVHIKTEFLQEIRLHEEFNRILARMTNNGFDDVKKMPDDKWRRTVHSLSATGRKAIRNVHKSGRQLSRKVKGKDNRSVVEAVGSSTRKAPPMVKAMSPGASASAARQRVDFRQPENAWQ